jgi:iron complex transport system substrate-binding protein
MMPRLLLVALVLPLLLIGCRSEAPPPADTRTVTDDLGRRVTLEPPVERVLTLAPSLTELIFAASAGDKLVGAAEADDYPPAVDTLPRFSSLPLDFETIATLEPDLVFATNQVNAPGDVDTFADLGIPVYFFSYAGLDGMLASLRTVGDLLGTDATAEATADSLAARIEHLRQRTDTLDARPLTLFLIGDETLFAFGRGSYVHDLIALAGGRSATADLDTQAPVLTEEFVLTTKPDVIIGAFGPDYDPGRLVELHPTWRTLPAVERGRVYSLDPDLVLRPGPRLVQGAYRMTELLHPQLFDTAAP